MRLSGARWWGEGLFASVRIGKGDASNATTARKEPDKNKKLL